jgi:RHS repeat-associated protein
VDRTSFVYAPDGTRLARIDPLGATLYIDGQEIKSVLGVLPVGQRFYSHAGTTVAVRHGEGLGLLVWQFNDIQGSAQIAIASGTPLPLRTYYAPYGEIRPLSAPPLTDRGWLGQPKDPTTGLNSLGARYYDAGLGRFISTDPANDLTSAQTANAYSYGANDPITYTDPHGLWSIGGALKGAWNWAKDTTNKAVDWVSEHKGLVVDIAVGIGVGIAIGAVCSTGVGCLILAGAAAGAAGAAAGYGVDVAEGKKEASWGGFLGTVGLGAAAGVAGGVLGKVAAPVLRKAGGVAASALSKTKAGAAVVNAASKAGGAFANGVRAAENGIEKGIAKVAQGGKAAANTVKAAVKVSTDTISG